VKYIGTFLLLIVLIIGCGTPPESQPEQPKRDMPGGVGLNGGQTGTGTTSGASTGY
jgi:hypothetical protein